MLITDEYRALNAKAHEDDPQWGSTGHLYAELVQQMIATYDTRDVLDYGCGVRSLEKALGRPIANYDPAIPDCSAPPEAHDIVVCTDVLEHIEPDCVTDVLAHLRALTRKVALLVICNVPAKKILPDGRNAHVTVQPARWWLKALAAAGFKPSRVGGDMSTLVVLAV